MRVSYLFWAGLATVATVVGAAGCNCSGACATASGMVVESDLPSPVVKVTANPPCAATVTSVDGGVQIQVTVDQPFNVNSCQIFEWLADGSELSATFSYMTGSGCCEGNATGGSRLQFTPVMTSDS